MAAYAAHFSYTCCIFSSTDFQCVCKVSIVCISTNKPTAPESSSSLHTSKILLQNDCACKHSQDGTKNVRQLPHQSSTGKGPFPAQARDHSQHKAFATYLQEKRCALPGTSLLVCTQLKISIDKDSQYGKYSYTVVSNSEPKFEIPLSIYPLLVTTRKKFLLYPLTSSGTAAILLDFLYWK